VVSTTKTINVNIYGTSNPYANTAWNNWSLKTTSVSNASSAAFKYADGTSSTVSATLSSSTAISDNGATYGSGIAPAQVLRYTSYYTNNRTLTLKGLSPSKKYSIELYASRNTSGSSTIFTVNGASQTISTYKNLTAKAVFSNLTCSASGQLVINLSKKGSFNCINGFVITEITNSTTNTMNTAPALDVVAEQPEIETETGLALYPNPATNHITLNVINDRQGTMQVSFLSVSGHVLKVVPLVKTERQSLYALSVEELPAGVYLLQVQMDGWRRTLKFLKQ